MAEFARGYLRVDVVEARLLALRRPAVGECLPRLGLVAAGRADGEDAVADREQVLHVDDVLHKVVRRLELVLERGLDDELLKLQILGLGHFREDIREQILSIQENRAKEQIL